MMIGGNTIGELQSKMSMKEFDIWMAYRRKYGPMNHVRMYDRPAALIASILGKTKMCDHMPFGKEEPKEATLDEILQAFGPGLKIGQRR